MTVARNNTAPALGETASPLAARLELLIRRGITVDQFEADMVRYCAANPDEVWNLLALLDQYHRQEKLPTELFRSLKAAADRYGLVHREPYIPEVIASPVPVVPPASAPAQTSQILPQEPTPAPEAESPAPTLPTPLSGPPPAPLPADPGRAPFRHLLDAASTGADAIMVDDARHTWQSGRFVRPEPPQRQRSWLRPLLLVLLLAAVTTGAALSGLLPDIRGLASGLAAVRYADVPSPVASTPAPAPANVVRATVTEAPETTSPAAAPDASLPVPPPPAPAVAAPNSTPSTMELSAGHYAVPPGDSAARIVVRRDGNLQGEVSFSWWTENASALADVDFIAWGHRSERIPAGRSSVTLLVPIINDATRTAPRSFTVILADIKGARPGATIRATVQLSGGG